MLSRAIGMRKFPLMRRMTWDGCVAVPHVGASLCERIDLRQEFEPDHPKAFNRGAVELRDSLIR